MFYFLGNTKSLIPFQSKRVISWWCNVAGNIKRCLGLHVKYPIIFPVFSHISMLWQISINFPSIKFRGNLSSGSPLLHADRHGHDEDANYVNAPEKGNLERSLYKPPSECLKTDAIWDSFSLIHSYWFCLYVKERTKGAVCWIEILYCSHVAKSQYVQLDVATCNLVRFYHCFTGICCLDYQRRSVTNVNTFHILSISLLDLKTCEVFPGIFH